MNPELPRRYRRPLRRRVMHAVRRGHLYLGLFMLPWVALYGVTAFLFNHPGAFNDQDARSIFFHRDSLIDTPMAAPPKPTEVAAEVVKALQERAGEGTRYELIEPASAAYNREFAFATVKPEEGDPISVLIEVNGDGGTIRQTPQPTLKKPERAPFAIGGSTLARERKPKQAAKPDGLVLESPLHERVKSAILTVLPKYGFPIGEVTVTSVPDLNFLMSDREGQCWKVTYNAQTGIISGKIAEGEPNGLTTRRFLTRLHLAHGYPYSHNTRWLWALLVDAMAFVMVFWAVSGLFMWWQLKATRLSGLLVILLSVAIAVALGMGMHEVLRS